MFENMTKPNEETIFLKDGEKDKKKKFMKRKIETGKIKIKKDIVFDESKMQKVQKQIEEEMKRQQAADIQAMKIMAGDMEELAKIEKAEMDELLKSVESRDSLIRERALDKIKSLVKGKSYTDENVKELLKQKSPMVRKLQEEVVEKILNNSNNLKFSDLKKLREMTNGKAKEIVEEFVDEAIKEAGW
jgi:hypothetical protein